MKTKWLDRRIAAPGPYLALCLSESEFKDALKRLKITHSSPWLNAGADATTHCFTNPDGKPLCVVALAPSPPSRTPVEVAGLLVHEAVHVWQEYAASIGEHNPGREQEAYGIQNIAQELFTEYARRHAPTR